MRRHETFKRAKGMTYVSRSCPFLMHSPVHNAYHARMEDAAKAAHGARGG